MKHILMNCINHPDLRWSCKEIAIRVNPDKSIQYDGSRTLHYLGHKDCRPVEECRCDLGDLRVIEDVPCS